MRRRDWLQWVGCGLSVSVVARATPGVRGLGVEELVAASSGVCAGTPTLVGARWAEVFGERRIVSHWQLRGAKPLAGSVALSVGVATLGGVVGDVQQWVPHEAKLSDGEPHVLFLMPGPLGSLWVTGMMQGAYQLRPTAQSAQVVLCAEQHEIAHDPSSACARLAGRSLDDVQRLLSPHKGS